MPSPNRFASIRNTVRNHPVVVATTAATAGVLLGGFVVVQVLAPPKTNTEATGTAQAAATVKTEPKAPAETTGSAPSGERVVSSDCDQQTWPNLTRDCMEDYRNKNRGPRVVTTDKLDKPTSEALPPAPAEEFKLAAPATWDPSVVSTEPLAAPPPATTASATPQVSDVAPSAPVAAAAPAVAEPPVHAAASTEPKEKAVAEPKEKAVAKKSKRKAKSPPKHRLDEDDDSFVANNDRDDDRADRRRDRSRRIVERWTERDYDVPDSRGGRRQVTVVRRGGGGGLFENLFGMGGRGPDDDDD